MLSYIVLIVIDFQCSIETQSIYRVTRFPHPVHMKTTVQESCYPAGNESSCTGIQGDFVALASVCALQLRHHYVKSRTMFSNSVA